MKKKFFMKKNIISTLCVSVLCLTVAIVSFAQEDVRLRSAAGDLYVITAKAGGVNYTEGKVAVNRSDGTSGYLVKGDSLEAGDKVSTAENSRAEVLMNPGSFARLNQNSEFEFITTSLNDLRLKVTRGSAIFEVFASHDFRVAVKTPSATFYLIKTGVYRIDVLGNGAGKLQVYRGNAQVGTLAADRIGVGRAATVDGDSVAVSRFDRKDMDEFEDWSKSRSKLIAKANKKLARNKLSNSLLGGSSGVDCFGSFGLWVFNPQYRSFSFLPFGSSWRSPYGHRLGTSTGICSLPRYYRPSHRYPSRREREDGNGGSGGGTSTNTVPAANVARAERNRTPPFRRMERSGNSNRGGASARRSSFPNRRRSSAGSSRTRSGSGQTRRTTTTRTTTTKSRTPVRTAPVIVRTKGKQ